MDILAWSTSSPPLTEYGLENYGDVETEGCLWWARMPGRRLGLQAGN